MSLPLCPVRDYIQGGSNGEFWFIVVCIPPFSCPFVTHFVVLLNCQFITEAPFLLGLQTLCNAICSLPQPLDREAGRKSEFWFIVVYIPLPPVSFLTHFIFQLKCQCATKPPSPLGLQTLHNAVHSINWLQTNQAESKW